MVGFNRRFSPLIIKLRVYLFRTSNGVNIIVNAGFIPPDMWVHDPESGGGRILGEGCHFIDLVSALSESEVETVSSQYITSDQTNLRMIMLS